MLDVTTPSLIDLIELEIVESISAEGHVRQWVKSTPYVRIGNRAHWVIPPDEDQAFVAAMEADLEVYQRSKDAAFHIVAMAERHVQLLKDLRPAITCDLPDGPGA